jgi:hypothetical protein
VNEAGYELAVNSLYESPYRFAYSLRGFNGRQQRAVAKNPPAKLK